jgi:hypothetical protein
MTFRLRSECSTTKLKRRLLNEMAKRQYMNNANHTMLQLSRRFDRESDPHRSTPLLLPSIEFNVTPLGAELGTTGVRL